MSRIFVSFKFCILCINIGVVLTDTVGKNVPGDPIFTTRPQEFIAQPGADLALPCAIEHNDGEDSVAWTHNNITFFVDSHKLGNVKAYSVQNDSINHTLFIKGYTPELAGNYTCWIPAKRIGITHVVGPKENVIIESVSSKKFVENLSELRIQCRAKGFPTPTISWFRKSSENAPEQDLKTNSSNFLIPMATFSDTGIYTCKADNGESSESRSVTVNVITGETSKVILVESGGNLTLPCHPSALQNLTQDESDFEWVTDNDIIIFSDGRLSPFVYLNILEPLYSVDNYSLIFPNIPTGNITFTCRLTRLRLNYTYFIQAKKNPTHNYNILQLFKPINFQRKGDTITLPCLTDDDIGKSTAGMNYTWLLINSQQRSVEVISLNQRILLRNNSANFRVTEDKSLIVPNFTPKYRIYYVCYISTGQSISHQTTVFDEDEKAVPENPKVLLIKKSIAVAEGNDVTLNCSPAGSQPDFVWIRDEGNLLSIGDGLIKSNESVHFKIGTDGRSLTIANFSSSLSGTYTCLSMTGQNYAYNVTEQTNPGNEFSYNDASLTNKESIFRTIAAEQGKYISLPCSLNNDEDESNFVWIRNKKEVLFMNGRVVPGSKSDKLKIADDKRSLVFSEFSYSLEGVYECRSRTGINYTYNITILSTSIFKKQTLVVGYGTRGTVLPCPAVNKNVSENDFSEWIFEGAHPFLHLNELLFFNKENFASFHNYYEINDDRSLVIKIMNPFQYGVYTCRWSTGEQYVYDVIEEIITWNNHTVWVNQGENITLPCPLQDLRDREYNVISWVFPVAKQSREFSATDGKIFPSQFNEIPDNIKLSDDKTSLIVSNITSNAEGDYYCGLVFSNTRHWYSIKIKDT